jgi:hypothetical protein
VLWIPPPTDHIPVGRGNVLHSKTGTSLRPKISWPPPRAAFHHFIFSALTPASHHTCKSRTRPSLSWSQRKMHPRERQSTLASAPSRPSRRKYCVILVTIPPVHDYGPVSDKLYTKPDQLSPIPWTSASTAYIPSMLASLVFRRHFALCLVLKEVWKSESMTLAQKFEVSSFWDHCGDTKDGSRAATWPTTRVATINVFWKLGIIVSKSEASDLCTRLSLAVKFSRVQNGKFETSVVG